MEKIGIISPHCDDETLGCGGTILRHIKKGNEVFWIIVTEPHKGIGFNKDKLEEHKNLIKEISKQYNFKKTIELNFPAAELDTIPQKKIIKKISDIIKKEKLEVIFLPFHGDVHSDHRIISECSISSIKWFRNQTVKKIIEYETLSETDFNLNNNKAFFPNMFIDISDYIEKKLKICEIYKNEFNAHPFPRSLKNVESLSIIRGATSGFKNAEAFKVLRILIN